MKRLLIGLCTIVFSITSAFAEFEGKYEPTDLYKNNVDSILYIETQDSSGSGVIIRSDGTFVTCFHVIANADYITVRMNDGSYYNVNGFRYINPLEDIAILTLDTKRFFKPIKIEQLNYLEIGEKVYTISNPQGLQFSFSDGMLNQYNEDYVQFSAPISPGSSGGALLNRYGELIGIIDAYIKLEGSQNLNLAVPNKYWKSKMYDEKVVNKDNLKWVDFIIRNADKDQFKLYSDYMSLKLEEQDFVTYYKYMKTLADYYGEDLPAYLYSMLGYFALCADEFQDAIKWYELSYKNKRNEEASLFSLAIAYYAIEDQKKGNVYLDLLKTRFSPSYYKLLEFGKQSNQCRKNDEYCYSDVGIDMYRYIAEITKFDEE